MVVAKEKMNQVYSEPSWYLYEALTILILEQWLDNFDIFSLWLSFYFQLISLYFQNETHADTMNTMNSTAQINLSQHNQDFMPLYYHIFCLFSTYFVIYRELIM